MAKGVGKLQVLVARRGVARKDDVRARRQADGVRARAAVEACAATRAVATSMRGIEMHLPSRERRVLLAQHATAIIYAVYIIGVGTVGARRCRRELCVAKLALHSREKCGFEKGQERSRFSLSDRVCFLLCKRWFGKW